jgi:hypothetical protein
MDNSEVHNSMQSWSFRVQRRRCASIVLEHCVHFLWAACGIFLAHPGKLGVCLVAVCKDNAYITWTEFVGKLRWESNANTEYGVLELGNGTMWQ